MNATTESVESSKSDRFSIRPSHLIPATLLALALFAASVAVGGAAAEANSANGVLFGASSATTGGQTQIQAIQELEGQLGAKLPLVRVFEQWDSNLNNRYNNWIVDGGRDIFMSIKPKTDSGGVVRWRSIANAQPGSSLHNNMVRLANDVKALDGDVWLAFHHEPETSDGTAWGSAADYQAAWRKFHTVFEQQGVDVNWVWTMTGWGFAVNTSDRRSVGKWYPGNAYVDYVGADLYNWGGCRNAREGWRDLRGGLDPVIKFADAKGKPIAIPEFASHESSSRSKGGWIDDFRSMMKESKYANRIALVIYYSSIDRGEPTCDWPLDSSSSSLAAASRLVKDPFFRDGGGTASAPATTAAPTTTRAPATTAPRPTTTAAAPTTQTGACTVQVVNGSDRISWQSQGSGFSYNIRRSGKWIKNVDKATSYRNSNVTSGSYVIVARDGKVTKRLSCSRIAQIAAPAPATTPTPTAAPKQSVGSTSLTPIAAIGGCRVDRIDGSDRVTWPNQGSGFNYRVLRNGSSIATTSNTWHWNRNVTTGNYTLVARKDNGIARLDCIRRN